MLPDIRKSIAFFESSQFSPARPSDKSTIKMKLINSNGGMILTGRNRSTRTSACHRAILSTTCLLRTGQGETGVSAVTAHDGLPESRHGLADCSESALYMYS